MSTLCSIVHPPTLYPASTSALYPASKSILYPASTCVRADPTTPCRCHRYAESVPDEDRPAFIDEDASVQRRLKDLKRRIRRRHEESMKHNGRAVSGATLPYVECVREYAQPEDFASRLYTDLLGAIQRDFPLRQIRSPLDAVFMRQIAFVQPLTRVYVGHDAVQERIGAYVGAMCKGGPVRTPLVLAGDDGSGKSAAFANWLMQTDVEGFVLPHFCSSTSNSADYIEILKRSTRAALNLNGIDSQPGGALPRGS